MFAIINVVNFSGRKVKHVRSIRRWLGIGYCTGRWRYPWWWHFYSDYSHKVRQVDSVEAVRIVKSVKTIKAVKFMKVVGVVKIEYCLTAMRSSCGFQSAPSPLFHTLICRIQ